MVFQNRVTIKDRLYKAMVKPIIEYAAVVIIEYAAVVIIEYAAVVIIEYAAVVWAPHTKRDIDMIERTQ